MRKYVIALGFLFSLTMVSAQGVSNDFQLSGEVVYQEIVKMDIQLEGIDAQIAEQLPKERKTRKVLYFTDQEALLENLRAEEPGDAMPMEGPGITIKLSEPDNKIFMDLKNKKVIEQKEFMSRIFLIESEMEQKTWKISGQQREILGYICQEAITQVDGQDVHAWFTPRIGVSAGPGDFNSLPGLVLAVEMNKGGRKLEAIGIELKPVDQRILKEPSKGKKVTLDEYQAIVTEKMKEMGLEGDGTWHESGGADHTSTVVIRIEQ